MDFILKYLDKFKWEHISLNKNLTEDFIEKYNDKLNWDYMSLTCSNFSYKFIKYNYKKINWENLLENENFTLSYKIIN